MSKIVQVSTVDSTTAINQMASLYQEQQAIRKEIKALECRLVDVEFKAIKLIADWGGHGCFKINWDFTRRMFDF